MAKLTSKLKVDSWGKNVLQIYANIFMGVFEEKFVYIYSVIYTLYINCDNLNKN